MYNLKTTKSIRCAHCRILDYWKYTYITWHGILATFYPENLWNCNTKKYQHALQLTSICKLLVLVYRVLSNIHSQQHMMVAHSNISMPIWIKLSNKLYQFHSVNQLTSIIILSIISCTFVYNNGNIFLSQIY